MKYLFLDTSATTTIVAVIINNKIKSIIKENNNQDLSSKLMVIIDKVLKKSKIKPKQIDKIFVTNGPGSFTGIRIGVTVAKTWAYSLNIPVIPLSSLEILASDNKKGNRVSLIDARRGYVYAGVYDENLNLIEPNQYILLTTVQEKYQCLFFSYDKINNSIYPEIDILKVVKKHENDKAINPHELNPNYLKITEAEAKLKVKNND